MPNVNVLDIKGNSVGSIDLPESLFGVEVNEHVVYEVVKNQLANKRQGTQSAKTRAEVRGGGRKPWRQKGTGRARQGSINLHNGEVVVQFLHQNQEITHTQYQRKLED